MMRVHESGGAAATIAGAVALPLPAGDVEGLRAAARSLDRVAARARSTLTVRGTLGARLGAVWTGDAATAAGAEAAELARRCHPVVDALPAAARALLAYAAALDHAIARVRSLQRQWDALDAEHVLTALRLAALPDPTGTIGVLGMERSRADQAAGRARLSRAYAGVIDELKATARRCAGRHLRGDRWRRSRSGGRWAPQQCSPPSPEACGSPTVSWRHGRRETLASPTACWCAGRSQRVGARRADCETTRSRRSRPRRGTASMTRSTHRRCSRSSVPTGWRSCSWPRA